MVLQRETDLGARPEVLDAVVGSVQDSELRSRRRPATAGPGVVRPPAQSPKADPTPAVSVGRSALRLDQHAGRLEALRRPLVPPLVPAPVGWLGGPPDCAI